MNLIAAEFLSFKKKVAHCYTLTKKKTFLFNRTDATIS